MGTKEDMEEERTGAWRRALSQYFPNLNSFPHT